MNNQALDALPVAAFTTDASGQITYFNDAAVALWGYSPEIGTAIWCGAWQLFSVGGGPVPILERPAAVAINSGVILKGYDAVVERPDGSRVRFRTFPTLLKDSAGAVIGTLNILVERESQGDEALAKARLAAIVASSDDAIISKTLFGKITTWNEGARRIFGYTSEEMIGEHITKIIPFELQAEEADILAKLRRGERIEHFDTIRLAKDGRRVNISLTVSPVRNEFGQIVGASKVARDITDRKGNEELQRLLFEELNHRVKNTLAIIQAIASETLKSAVSPSAFVASFTGRLRALARAYDVLALGKMRSADLRHLVRDQVELGNTDGNRIECAGPNVSLDPRAAIQLALVLYELATNARKYGSLSVPHGRLSITWTLNDNNRTLQLFWVERSGPRVTAPNSRGFGTLLIEQSLKSTGGTTNLRYEPEGLICEITLSLNSGGNEIEARQPQLEISSMDVGADLRGMRILVVEDDFLIAADLKTRLIAIGCRVVGPANTVDEALHIIDEQTFDLALVDANLSGLPVDEIAAALTRKRIGFAFVTGYGRSFLPAAFRDTPILPKPFADEALKAILHDLSKQQKRKL